MSTAISALALWDCFQTIPDPRQEQGRRYSLPAMLGVVIAGLLCNRLSLRSIARWAKKLTPKQLAELGIERPRAPGQSAMHALFDKLPATQVELALGAWVNSLLGKKAPGHIVLDGKTLRASAGADYPALHLLAAFCVDVHGVLREEAVGEKANEITAAKLLLGQLPVKGALVTGDAMFCQKEFCRRITEAGGHFIFTVKDNQSALKEDVATTFAAVFSPAGGRSARDSKSRHDGKTTRAFGGKAH
jgi:hypothetical protein